MLIQALPCDSLESLTAFQLHCAGLDVHWEVLEVHWAGQNEGQSSGSSKVITSVYRGATLYSTDHLPTLPSPSGFF